MQHPYAPPAAWPLPAPLPDDPACWPPALFPPALYYPADHPQAHVYIKHEDALHEHLWAPYAPAYAAKDECARLDAAMDLAPGAAFFAAPAEYDYPHDMLPAPAPDSTLHPPRPPVHPTRSYTLGDALVRRTPPQPLKDEGVHCGDAPAPALALALAQDIHTQDIHTQDIHTQDIHTQDIHTQDTYAHAQDVPAAVKQEAASPSPAPRPIMDHLPPPPAPSPPSPPQPPPQRQSASQSPTQGPRRRGRPRKTPPGPYPSPPAYAHPAHFSPPFVSAPSFSSSSFQPSPFQPSPFACASGDQPHAHEQQQPALSLDPLPLPPSEDRPGQALFRLSAPGTPREPARKKPVMACLFCRERKIACGAGPGAGVPGVLGESAAGAGRACEGEGVVRGEAREAREAMVQTQGQAQGQGTCNQCARRGLECVYPKESRRGQHKRGPRAARVRALAEAAAQDADRREGAR